MLPPRRSDSPRCPYLIFRAFGQRVRLTSVALLSAREHLHRPIKLRVTPCRVARVEWDFDRRRDADPFEALTVDQHVLDCEQEQPVVADQERRRREHRAFGAMADELAKPVFLEPIGEHLLAAAGAFVDQSSHRLAPFHIDEADLAIAVLDLHGWSARVEEVEILRLRAAPSAPQVPDQRVGVLQRSVGHQVLERGLNPSAGIGPDMHVANFDLVRGDDSRALFEAAQEHLVRVEIGWRYADRDRRGAGGAADLKRDWGSNLAAERADRAERTIVRRYDFIAEQNAGAMRGRALDDAGYEGAALIVGLGEHANSRIGYLPSGEKLLKAAMLERAHENIRELVIGGIFWRVIVGVGGAQFRQHGVDDHRRVFPRARGCRVRAEADALFLPVEAVEAGIVEAVAHEFPDLVEVGLI